MGGKQSRASNTAAQPTVTSRRKRVVSETLQKSREKRLTAVLQSSESNLCEWGADRRSDSHSSCADLDETELGESTPLTVTGKEGDRNSLEVQVKLSHKEDSTDSEHSSVSEEMAIPAVHTTLEASDARENGPELVALRRGRKSFQPLGKYDRSSSFHDDVDKKASKINVSDYIFHFQNLVFEGGGNKGLAYCGAVQCLEELGLMRQVKRFAGASAGGMVAGLLAVGYTAAEIEQFLADRIDKVFLDASCGYCSLLPNILRNFGWNPGRRIYKWFGDKLRDKTGDADVTFQQLYQRTGRVLCIVVTNLSQMATEYCHPKTTPDMPIRMALRMSMAIPGLFSAMRYNNRGSEDVYVDGGVLCNYPVHCFDGWYLSLDPKDSFLRRLQPLRDIPLLMERSNRFGRCNDKTLGMLLYSNAEEDLLRMNLERRVGCLHPAVPRSETKLFQQREKEARQKVRIQREYAQVVQAVDSFLRVLTKHNIDGSDVIKKCDLEAAFKDEAEFPRYQAEVLFGKDFNVNEAFDLLDIDDNGKVVYDELVRFIEEHGVCLQSRFLGYQRREIKNFVSFLNSLTSTLTFNVQKLYVEEGDMDRTVGINTGHVQTTDFKLEEPDRDFVVQRGYNSMKAFLRYYVVRHPDKVEEKTHAMTGIEEISDSLMPQPPTVRFSEDI